MLHPQAWSSDRRLDILVLGPMSEDETISASCVPVQRAVEGLLDEPEFAALLSEAGVSPGHRTVHVPERIFGLNITDGVLSRIDIADLVIFNLTPKDGREEASGNVFYELGIVHALGIPTILVMEEGKGGVPFYAREMLHHKVPDFSEESLKNGLRGTLLNFLRRGDPSSNYGNNRLTLFYGLPIVDISAAMGLATGYYYNFISRLIMEGGFLADEENGIGKVVMIRPRSIQGSYQADIAALKKALGKEGITLETKKLDPPPGDTLGPLWFDHAGDVVVDLPRTIYPLQRAPRLLAYRNRKVRGLSKEAEQAYQQRLAQSGESLMDRFFEGLRYQIEMDGLRVRGEIVHMATFEEAPALISRLSSS